MLTVFTLIVLLFSIVIHEIAHGSVAYYLGDPTAKHAGRLTINPLKHLDPFGSVILPLLLLLVTFGRGPIFGWAKPVPINPYNFRDKKWGNLKVALAGPGSNLAIALCFGFLLRFFNLPLQFLNLLSIIVILNLLLGIFNLIPIPPLDGSHILFSLLPAQTFKIQKIFFRYGIFILILFIFLIFPLIFPLIFIIYRIIVGKPF